MRNFLENTYLGRVFKADKVLFAVIMPLVLLTLFNAVRRSEQFPGLLYGMYSQKESALPDYTTYELYIAGQRVDYLKLWDINKELINTPLSEMAEAHEQGKISNEQWVKFQQWLFSYCADMRFVTDNTLKIYKVTVAYLPDGKLKTIKRELIADYATN